MYSRQYYSVPQYGIPHWSIVYDILYVVFHSTVWMSLKEKYFFLGFCAKVVHGDGFAEDTEHLASLLTGYVLLKKHAVLLWVIFIEIVRLFPLLELNVLKKVGVKCWLLLSVIIRVIRSVYTMRSTLRIFSNFIFSPKFEVGYQINCQKLVVWIEAIQKLLHGTERLLLERSTRVNCVSVVALWGQINKYSVLLAWSFCFL